MRSLYITHGNFCILWQEVEKFFAILEERQTRDDQDFNNLIIRSSKYMVATSSQAKNSRTDDNTLPALLLNWSLPGEPCPGPTPACSTTTRPMCPPLRPRRRPREWAAPCSRCTGGSQGGTTLIWRPTNQLILTHPPEAPFHPTWAKILYGIHTALLIWFNLIS